MSRSHHIKSYSSKTAEDRIRLFLVEIAEKNSIGISATSRDYDILIHSLRKLRKQIEAVYRRGGTTAVLLGDRLITAYRAGSFNTRKIEQELFAPNLTYKEMQFLKEFCG